MSDPADFDTEYVDYMLTKHKVVLERLPSLEIEGENVVFFGEPLGDEIVLTRVMLRVETWEEMGGPNTITVTVEPGDQLND